MVKPDELQAAFDLDFVPPALSPSEHYYPGQGIPAVVNAAERVVEILYWGLIPSWAKDISIAKHTFNARKETLREKASYRMALCEEDYEKLTDESYTEQFQTVLENSKSVTENGTGDTFQVLTELNNFEENLRETIAFNSEIGSRLLKQQKILRALQEKENVYAGTLVRMDAVTRNYADTMQENQKLKEENKDLKQRMKLTDKFYAQQRENISAQLDEMSSRLISSLEEYFSRPVREKNQVSVSNRTKTELIRIIFETIDNVKKGKSE